MKVQSKDRPNAIKILGNKVLIRSNIQEKTRVDMNEEQETYYQYDEERMTKDEYILQQAEQNTLETKILTLPEKIALYRYHKQRYFHYDGHIQRFDSYDVQRITDFAEALVNGIIAEIQWKYPDCTIIITDAQYLKNMKIAWYMWEEKVRGIEKQLNEDETVTENNYQEKFEELLKKYLKL